MQIWAESGKSALPICNYSQILYQFLTFTQNLKRSREFCCMLSMHAFYFKITANAIAINRVTTPAAIASRIFW